MDNQDKFAWFCAEHAIAHAPSAWAAWSVKEREVRMLHAHIMSLQERCEHLEQHCYELEQRQERLRLVHSAA